jgi:hypothetical protein
MIMFDEYHPVNPCGIEETTLIKPDSYVLQTEMKKIFFINLFKKYGVTKEGLDSFRFIGSDGNKGTPLRKKYERQLKCIAKLKLHTGLSPDDVENAERCLCLTTIQEVALIQKFSEKEGLHGEMIPIGNCCATKFLKQGKKQFCRKCGISIRKHKSNLCNECVTTTNECLDCKCLTKFKICGKCMINHCKMCEAKTPGYMYCYKCNIRYKYLRANRDTNSLELTTELKRFNTSYAKYVTV